MEHYLTIAIDLGARSTGVWSSMYAELDDPAANCNAGMVAFDPGSFELAQRNRTQMRHARRGTQRRKLAKRLVELWLAAMRPEQFRRLSAEDKAGLRGLMNRRGFTHYSLDEAIDDSGLDEYSAEYACLLGDDGPSGSLVEWLRLTIADPSGIAQLLSQPLFTLENGKRREDRALDAFLRERLEANDLFDTTQLKAVARVRDTLRSLLRKASDAGASGHRHRGEYLEAIRHDLANSKGGKRLCQVLAINDRELTSLIGHVGNWTLKALRGYFHDPSKASARKLDVPRFHAAWHRWFQTWTVEGESGERRAARATARREWLKRLGNTSPGDMQAHWQSLTDTDPMSSTPPFESQANRRPPVCQSLLLYPSALDRHAPNWRSWTQNLLRHDHDTERLGQGLQEIGNLDARVIDRHVNGPDTANADASSDDWRWARGLQRLLERSRKADVYALRAQVRARSGNRTVRGLDEAQARLVRNLGAQHVDDFLDFAGRYFDESRGAREGMWGGHAAGTDALLRLCKAHPPHKGKVLDSLVCGVLSAEVSERQVLDALDAMNEKLAFPEDRALGTKFRRPPKRKVMPILRELVEMQKKLGGRLRQFADDAERIERSNGETPTKDDLRAKAWTAWRWAEVVADALGQKLSHQDEQIARYRNPYSLAQLHQLLFEDKRGFASNCRGCQRENAWRAQLDTDGFANASRLPADSVRPFDGMLARLLSALAMRIARQVVAFAKQQAELGAMPDRLAINLIIEENRFEFAEQMSEVKKLSKAKRDDRSDAAERDREAFENNWNNKRARIREASCGLCAYTGAPLGDTVEYDHIISQALTGEVSGYSFDAEANLLCVSPEGNRLKGRSLYDFDNLHGAYLAAVFPGMSRSQAQQDVAQRARAWLDNRNLDRVAFHQLPDESRRAVRHALFVPELRGEVMARLAQQNRTRVNGTQRWFLRRLWECLRPELQRVLPQARLSSTPCMHRVKADTVAALRRELAALDENYRKQHPQPPYSHAIDAALAFAVASTNPAARTKLGLAGNDDAALDEFADPGRVAALMPASLWLDRIVRKPIYAKSNPQHRALFKSQLLGERFIPLIVDADQTVRVGFGRENWIEVTVAGRKKLPDGAPAPGQRLLTLLWPVLSTPDGMTSPDLAALAALASSKRDGLLWIEVDRRRAFDHWQAHANDGDDELLAALRALHYVVARKSVVGVLENSGKPAPGRDDLLKNFRWKTKVALKRAAVGFDGTLTYPARSAWERIADDPDIAPHLGLRRLMAATSGDDAAKTPQDSDKTATVDWPKVMARHFPRLKAQRKHARIRQVWSLPVVSSASGGFRLNRRDMDGGLVRQLAQVEKGAYAGFARDDDKPLGFDKGRPVRMVPFRQLVGLEKDAGNSGEKVGFDDYCPFPLPNDVTGGLQRLEIAPGTKSRRAVRLRISHQGLRALVGEGLPDDLLRDGSDSIKPDKAAVVRFASLLHSLTGLSSLGPRDSVGITHITRDHVELSYTAGGGGKAQA